MSGQGPPGVPPAQGALNNTSYNVGQQHVSQPIVYIPLGLVNPQVFAKTAPGAFLQVRP